MTPLNPSSGTSVAESQVADFKASRTFVLQGEFVPPTTCGADGQIDVEGALAGGGVEPGAATQVAFSQEFDAVGAQPAARPSRTE